MVIYYLSISQNTAFTIHLQGKNKASICRFVKLIEQAFLDLDGVGRMGVVGMKITTEK